MDLGLKGRTYIVTGGTNGLGLAAAEVLIDEGASVVASSPSGTWRGCPYDDGRLRVAAVGNADPNAPKVLISAAQESFGGLDGALLSVGGPPLGPLASVTDDQWRAAFESVFLGAVRLARALVTALQPGGVVGLVLSSSVRTPLANLAISNGFRPGLAALVKELADENGVRGVRVIGLVPGRIATARTNAVDEATPGARERSEAQIPLGRLGTPDEFGRVAAFLLSPAASYVNGTSVVIDGGYSRAH